MEKIAFDAALLFPIKLERELIELNHSLKRTYSPARIYLNNKDCFPHLSLLMGIIDYERGEEIKEKLEEVSYAFNPIELKIKRFDLESLPVKDEEISISGISFEKNSSLLKLHESVAKSLKEFLIRGEVNKEMMYAPDEINAEDTPWMFPYIQNFLENSGYEKFNPHITIGDGILESQDISDRLIASRLAICQLGNYCTCRKIIYETKLKKLS